MLTNGKKECKNADIAEIEPVINTKLRALTKYKHDQSQRNLQALKFARGKVKQTAPAVRQHPTSNIRRMYECIKQATGKPVKSMPLKSKTEETITDQDK